MFVTVSVLSAFAFAAPQNPSPLDPQPRAAGLIAQLDVNYGLPGQFFADQRLDFYQQPIAGGGPQPTVVFVHGGGFYAGNENIDIGVPEWQDVLARGWSIASIQYRLSPATCADLGASEHPIYPGQVHDLSLALQFLRQRASAWNIDASKLALYGKSAGGCLATWVALAADHAGLADGVGHGAGLSTRAHAVLNGGGPTDWTYDNPHAPPALVYFGLFPSCPASVQPSQATLLEASSFWQATQAPQNGANQLVAVRNGFSGPIGGNLHDPYYGIQLHGALVSASVGSVSSFLAWDLGPQVPPGMDPAIGNNDWFELALASIPFGSGKSGSLQRPPSIALSSWGPDDSLLLGNCPANASATLWIGTAALPSAGPAGAWIESPTPLASATTNGRGDALFDLDLAPYLGSGAQIFLQATCADAAAPGGFAASHGLRIDL